MSFHQCSGAGDECRKARSSEDKRPEVKLSKTIFNPRGSVIGVRSGAARRRLNRWLLVCAGLATLPALAADISLSGFGTLGYVRSDKSYKYQRFIDQRGTLKRDSVAGLQADFILTDSLGATAQLLAAPASDNDRSYEATVAWAFLSWRPTNDWLIRAGKQRIPLYLHSQTYNVGVTYDLARLPTEMYSISPSNDFTGLSASKNWEVESGELVLDAYWGKSDLDVRFWFRDGIPPTRTPGALFRQLGVEGGGIVLSYKRKDDTYRIGLGRVRIDEKNSANAYPVTYPFVSLFPGVGYYQVDASLPGPGIPSINSYGYKTLTLGADVNVGSGFRIMSEMARSKVSRTSFSTQSVRGYASVLKRIDKWTPYVTYAFLRSDNVPLNLRESVNKNTVPNFIPGAAQINASQRTGADSLLVYDQNSWALGTSYALSVTSSIKAEYMRTHVRRVSSLVDAPPGSDVGNQKINVLSVSYSFVF